MDSKKGQGCFLLLGVMQVTQNQDATENMDDTQSPVVESGEARC